MIDLTNQTQTLSGKSQKIIRWEVWFQTPMGLTESLALAVEKCQQNDLPVEMMIKPVAVAITEEGDYEVSIR